MECVVGVDLGGTNVRAALVDANGAITGTVVALPSQAKVRVDSVVDALSGAILSATGNTKPKAIGIAVPGHIDSHEGHVLWAPNFGSTTDGEFRMWRDVPLKSLLEKRIGSDCPIVLANDANAAALGEYRYGVGESQATCLVLFTLGTGIGSGVILGRKATSILQSQASMLLGANGGASELGHTTVELGGALCTCGAYGCVEAYCGTPGLLRIASEVGVMVESALELSNLADEGEESALNVWRAFGRYLGAAVGNSVNAFAPDVVAIGGQVSGAWHHFSGSMLDTAERQSIPSLYESVRIVRARHAGDAGILGAAALAWGEVK